MWRALPGLVFLLLCIALLWALEYKNIPSVARERLAETPVPSLQVTGIDGNASLSDLSTTPLPRPVFISFFASWCTPCVAEHSLLMEVSGQPVTMIGVGFGDTRENLMKMMKDLGNPYDYIGIDQSSKTAMAFGLKGVPESFLIDKTGMIRFAQRGVLTPDVIKTQLIPLIQKYAK